MIVAASAADGLPEQGFSKRIDLLIDVIHFQLQLILLLVIMIAQGKSGDGNALLLLLLQRVRGHQVPRYLLRDKLIDGPVFVEGADQIVSVSPCVLKNETSQGQRLRITKQIHPMASEAFTETRRCKQGIDMLLQQHLSVFIRSHLLQ